MLEREPGLLRGAADFLSGAASSTSSTTSTSTSTSTSSGGGGKGGSGNGRSDWRTAPPPGVLRYFSLVLPDPSLAWDAASLKSPRGVHLPSVALTRWTPWP